nr:DUF4011 domain-containing protein [Conyzicola lurida]
MTVVIDAVPVLSYAAAHNRLPVINGITIANPGDARPGAVLRVGARSALGVLSVPFERLIDLGAADTVRLTDVPLVLDAAAMLSVEERRPASITAVIEHDGVEIASSRVEVDLLAAHQWVRNPPNLSLELLAAYVQPNHPAIARLLAAASDRLEATTGSGSLQGYQAGEERVDEIVRAVFESMQAVGVRYSEPPASWGDDGQKVRTPGEVLDGRVGTCLDTTLVMAAALEQAGINPLLWLVDGHAFLGYWRTESHSGVAATTEYMDAVNLVDLGSIGLVETTMVTDAGATFEAARRRPVVEHTQGRPEHILGITDVAAARRSTVFPLPARTNNPDGTVTVTMYQPAAAAQREYEEYERLAAESPERATVPYRVAQWKNALLDLSLRNRLINFSDAARLTLAVPDSDVAFLEDLVTDGKPISLKPSDDLAAIQQQRGIRFGRDLPEEERTELLRDKREVFSDITTAAYTAKLRALAYKAKTIEEETGANNLYLAFGTLVWNLNGKDLRSPLVLVPVKIDPGRGGRYRISQDESGTSTPNYCLLEKLKQSFGLEIPGLAEPEEDAAGIDLAAAFQATRLAIAEAGLPFRVESTIDLSILQFAKFRLWKDLDENWEEFAKNPLVRHLIESPTEEFVDPVAGQPDLDLDGLGALSPIPADASQLGAIAAAVSDQTFVLEGPPGTGKSQTITNLLVRAIAEGKKVLFVAEKRAALQVVQRRLDEVGLGAFTLDLHDKGSRPLAVRAQIKDALQHRVTADRDGIQAARDTLDGSRRSLARYATRLHEKNAAGLSLYSARTRLLAADPLTPTMDVPDAIVTAAPSDSLRALFRLLPDVADNARPAPNHPWSLVDSAVGVDGAPVDQARLLAALAAVDESVAALPTTGLLAAPLDRATSLEGLRAIAGVVAAPTVPLAALDGSLDPAWSSSAARAHEQLDAVLQSYRTTLGGVAPGILSLDLTALHTAAVAADESGFFGRKKRRLAVRAPIEPFVSADELPKPRDLTAFALRLAQLQQQAVAVRAAYGAVSGLEQPSDWNPLVEADSTRLRGLSGWITWLGQVLPASDESGARAYYAQRAVPEPAGPVTAVVDALVAVDAALTPDAVETWSDGRPLLPLWRATAPGRAVSTTGHTTLANWIALIDYVEPLHPAGLGDARRDILTGVLPPENAIASFEKGVATASLRERAASTTLDAFDAAAHGSAVDRFTDSSERTRQLLVTDIPADLLERRTFDIAGTTGQIGELKRQLDRQRGGLGVRSLLEKFGPLISELTPCTLMSPESVARFFGATADLFDIVVFDEASQIRVADAIGAMGRGRSVVIVGDSKQMPPTSFAEITVDVDDTDRGDGQFVQDEESILSECVSAQVPSRALTWHYRSQDESLISFSNEHYYGNLSSFPSPLHGSSDNGIAGHGISLVRVDGKFLRSGAGKALRTNPVEAEAIVAEIERRFAGSPVLLPSLGVVTFNAQQRALIESLLRDAGDPRIVEALDDTAEGIFVKNLENVQGDERDTILFSTAFSANEKGTLPLNFGPVGQAGGERRLNVAITRARRQVVLFSSFDPGDLRAEETTSIGLKHLKLYLELAAAGSPTASAKFGENSVDRHREEIAGALRDRGLVVTTDVGLSDFRIDLSIAAPDDPTQPLVAVLLDNEAWARRATVADRDGLPDSVLRHLMKWPGVSRVWMPDWLENRADVVDRLVAQTDEARENLLLSEVAVEVEAAPVVIEAAPTIPQTVPDDDVFVPWVPRVAGTVEVLDRLPDPDAAAQVTGVIREIVETEGPVNIVRLAKLTASAFELDRVVQARVLPIVECVPNELRVAGDTGYAWPPRVVPSEWDRARRTPADVDRDIEHVHPRELVNAMVAIAITSAGLYEDELRRETSRFFGYARVTPKVAAVLDAAIARAEAEGRLEHTPAGLIAATEADAEG